MNGNRQVLAALTEPIKKQVNFRLYVYHIYDVILSYITKKTKITCSFAIKCCEGYLAVLPWNLKTKYEYSEGKILGNL